MEGYSQAREVRPLGAAQAKKAPATETIGKRMTDTMPDDSLKG
jgi:hypothetical protein